MGSPLEPVLANLFMEDNEKLWIENFQGTPLSYYRIYVDDIFSVFNNSFEAKEFFNYINTRHPYIKFTIETEVNKIILFLDVLIDNRQNILKTSIDHKSTYSGLLLNYTNFTSRFYKISLMKCLIDRAYKINNNWPGFHEDVSKINNIWPGFHEDVSKINNTWSGFRDDVSKINNTWPGFHDDVFKINNTWSGFHNDLSKINNAWPSFHDDVSIINNAWSGFHDELSKINNTWPGFHEDVSKINNTWSGFHDDVSKINNTWSGFHEDVSKIKDVLKRNSYPPFILDKIIKAYIEKIHYNNNKVSSEVNK